SFMRISLRRLYGRGDLHFVTFSCYRRLPLLGSVHARDHFVKIPRPGSHRAPIPTVGIRGHAGTCAPVDGGAAGGQPIKLASVVEAESGSRVAWEAAREVAAVAASVS